MGRSEPVWEEGVKRIVEGVLVLACCLTVGCRKHVSQEVIKEIAAPADTAWNDLPRIEPAEDDWPWWRGPTLDNKAAPGQDPPVRWSETENVVWKIDVPGRGHGTPCLWGNRIFLATAEDDAAVQSVLCHDRATGRRLWRREIHRGGFMHRHAKNSHASCTPACDGGRVFVTFMVQGGIWITALSLDGEKLWQKRIGPFLSKHGYAPSPHLYGSLVIVLADNDGPSSYLAALHRTTGRIVWRIRRASRANFASPVVADLCGRDQLLITGPYEVSSYDPNTGERFWHCDGPTTVAANTMTFGDELVYASAGYPRKNLLCIRADGSGDVTNTHTVWRRDRDAAYVPSLLLHEGLLLMVNDRGQTRCFEAETGALLWQKRLQGNYSSSPVLCGDNIYVVNEAGLTTVFRIGSAYRLVAQNDLGDGGFATPVICGGRIHLRTLHHLYCLGDSRTD